MNEETTAAIEQQQPAPLPPTEVIPIGATGIISLVTAGAAWIGRKWWDERSRAQEAQRQSELQEERDEHSIVVELLKQSAAVQKELFKLLNNQSQGLQQQGGAIRELSLQLQQFSNSLRNKVLDSYQVKPIHKPEFSNEEKKSE